MTGLLAAVTVVGIANLRRPRGMGQGVLAWSPTKRSAAAPQLCCLLVLIWSCLVVCAAQLVIVIERLDDAVAVYDADG